MKKFLAGLVCGLMLVAVLAYAQSYGGVGASPIAPTVDKCPLSSSQGFLFCAVGTVAPYTMYVSYAGATPIPLVPVATVTSFNKRTGDVTLTKADVVGTGVGVTTTASSTIQ